MKEKDINIIKIIPVVSNSVIIENFSKDQYLLKQSEYGFYLKINKDVFNLLKLFDGNRNLQEISIMYNKNYKENINEEFIYNLFFKKLVKYGILDNTIKEAIYIKKPDYLKVSFIVINKKILSRITPYFSFLFRRKIMISLFLLSLVIINLTCVLKYDLLTEEVAYLEGLIFFFILMFLSATLHEIGHASAASYFGANHGGIGGGFYLLSPVYFADVTDIWKLKKEKRIIVNLAGIYFDLIFCAIVMLISLFLDKKTLFLTSILIVIHSIYNLIPFLRNDGYWILSDITGITNLYSKSNIQLSSFLGKLFNKKKSFISSKENVFLVLYAIFNFSILVFFLIYVAFFNLTSLLNFPYDFYIYITSVIKFKTINISGLSEFIIPVIFYYLIFNILKNWVIKKIRK